MPPSSSRFIALSVTVLSLLCLLLCALVTPAQAQTAPQAIGIAVGGDNQTQLLWKNPDTSAAYWKLNADGSVASQSTFGPFATYTPSLIAAGPDSVPRILWNKSGTPAVISLWHNVQNAPGYDHHEFTNPSGFVPLSLAVDNGNLVRLFWSNAAGAAEQWQIAADNTVPYDMVYGPFSTYAPVAFAFGGSANVPRALWNKTDGTASVWYDVPGMTDYATQNFGPFSPYQAKLLAVGPNGVPRLLWNNGSGVVSLWYNVQGASGYGHSEYPIPSGYAAVGMAVGTDNTVRLLWSGPSGLAQVWTIQPGGTYTVKTYAYNAGTPAQDIPAPGWGEDVTPTDDASDGEEDGPASAGSVNLASGVAENHPGPDLWAYNPLGPGATYARLYRSKRAQQGYGSPGLSAGWTDNFDLFVTPVSGGYTLTYDNGGQDAWTGSTGSLTTPAGAPYLVSVAADGSSLTMTFKDRSKYTFTRFAAATPNYVANTYLLTRIANLVGHAITLNRDTAANGYRVKTVTNDAATPVALLTFGYDGNGKLSTLTDNNARRITYGFTSSRLTSVSQIGTAAAPGGARWGYGYDTSTGAPLLASVQAPDPSNSGGMAMATTVYDTSGKVAQHQDAAGRTRTYAYSGTQTQVQVNNANGSLAEKWTQKNLTGAGSNTDGGMIDAASKASSVAYGGASSPYLPSAVTNRNNQTASVTYDASVPASAKYGNVATVQSPRGVRVTTAYQYPTDFPLGQVQTVTQSIPATGETKQPTTFSYYGSTDGVLNGLLKSVTSPTPDTTIANAGVVQTNYGYDSLGNVTQMKTPGANGTTTITYGYTTDGTFSQPEAVGEPLTVSVSGPDWTGVTTSTVTHYRYDAFGNRTAVIDASGYEIDFVYNVADQLTDTIYPATGDTGAGRTKSSTVYQYPGGPVSAGTVTGEGGTQFRQVLYSYGSEGELLSLSGNTYPVSYTYDGRGRVSTVTYYGASLMDAHTTTYSYDAVGNLASVRYPGATGAAFDQLFYLYDADGNLTQETDGVGVVKTYGRADPESLLTGISYTYPSGYGGTKIGAVGFTYDKYGRRATMTDDTGTKTYTYDDLDETQNVTTDFSPDAYSGIPAGLGQQLAYRHYADGSRASLALPGTNDGSTQVYVYDGVGRLAGTYLNYEGFGLRYTYQPNGWLTRTQGVAFNPITNQSAFAQAVPFLQVDRTYNPRGFLATLTNSLITNPAQPTQLTLLSAFTGPGTNPARMTYDPVGNRTKETSNVPARGAAPDLSRTLTYTYDALDQLTGESAVGTVTSGAYTNTNYAQTFVYDLAGNPTSVTTSGSGQRASSSSTFNADNQSTGTTYTGNGDPTTLPVFSFTDTAIFDAEDRLATIFNPGFHTRYDGDGLRAEEASTGLASLNDGDQTVGELSFDEDSRGYENAFNGFGASGWEWRGLPNASSSSGVYIAFTYDPQGSLVQPVATYGSGTAAATVKVYSSSAYDGFGLAYTHAADTGTFDGTESGFGGQWGYYRESTTGQYLLGHRYYDPQHGRFVNRDPIGYGGGLNLYGFTGNNPITGSDPSGYNPFTDFLGKETSALGRSLHKGGQLVMDFLEEAAEAKAEGYGELSPVIQTTPDVDPLASPNARAAEEENAEVQRTTQSFYSHLRDPRGVGPGKLFTTKQQNEIYKANMERNGGVLRDDETGEILVRSKKDMLGIKNPPANGAQIDHIIPRKPSDANTAPGTNSYRNARVISRQRNRAKSNN